MPSRTTSRSSPRSSRRAPCARWSKPMATGTARRWLRGQRCAVARRGWRWRLVEEAARLREAGIDAPILVLSECRPEAMRRARDLDLRMTLYSADGIAAAAATAARGAAPWPVHLKVDTGMHRVGASPDEIVARARAIVDAPGLELEALWTHCAVADDLDNPFTATQLDRFEAAVAALDANGYRPAMLHAANSAVALLHPRGRYDMVRLGISMYGCPPASHHHDLARALRPALRLVSRVSHVQVVAAGEGVSYGHRWRADRDNHGRDGADRIRRRRAARSRARGWQRAHRWESPSHHRRRHDGPTDGRLCDDTGRGRRRGRVDRRAG